MKRFLSIILAAIMIVSAVPLVSAGYTPAKVTGLKTKFSTVCTAKLSWTAVKNTTGYKIFKYNSKTGEYTALAKTTGTAKTIKGLKSDTTYKFAVRAFRRVDGKVYFGKYSDKITVKTIAITKEDTKLLEGMLDTMQPINGGYGYHYQLDLKYDYKKSSYKKMISALINPLYFGFWWSMFNHYRWSKYIKSNYFDYYDESKRKYCYENPDPLDLMGDWYEYNKVNGKKLDWIIRNVFNKKPDHSYIEKGEYGVLLYYFNGSYYTPFGDGADIGLEHKIISKKPDSSGNYTMKFTASEYKGIVGYSGTTSPSYTIKAALKLVDGKRVWSIYKIY